MEIKVDTLEDGRAKITVTVEAKTVTDRVAKKYREIARRNNFPGFRKGKAPRRIIDNVYGVGSVIAMVTEDMVNDLYPMALDDSGVMPLGQPDFGGDVEPLVEGEDFVFSFTTAQKPAFELSSYEPVEIEMLAEGASDKEIDEQIDMLTGYYVKWEDARANTKVKKDSRIEMAIEATDAEGKAIESINSESRTYVMGSTLFPAAFDEQLIGLKKGEEKEFELAVDAEEPGALLSMVAGQTIKVKVTLIAVKKEVKPEITDEWVKDTLGFESVEELRNRVSDQIIAQKADILPRMKEERCLEVLRNRLEDTADESLCEEVEASLLQDFFTQLQRQGMTFDNYLAQQGLDTDGFREDVKQQAKDVANEELAVEAWARHFEIVATPEDITEEFEAAGLDGDIQKIIQEWRENGRLHLVREAIVRRKAIEAVMEGAIVTETTDAE